MFFDRELPDKTEKNERKLGCKVLPLLSRSLLP